MYVLLLVFSYFSARYLRVVLHKILDKKTDHLPVASQQDGQVLNNSELTSYLISVVIEVAIANAFVHLIWYGIEPFVLYTELNILLQRSFTSLPFLLASMYTIQAGWGALITWRKSQTKKEPAPIE